MGQAASKGPRYTNAELLESLEAGDAEKFVESVAANRKVARRILRDRNGDTGLHVMATHGILNGMIETVALVLRSHEQEKGSVLPAIEVARVMSKLSNIRNDRGRTPLMLASKGGHVEVVGFLLEHHGNVWLRDHMGGAHAVHYAASAGKDDCVVLLVEHAKQHPPPPSPAVMVPQPLLELGTVNGLTPLHYAAWHKRPSTVLKLCQLGASIYARSTWGAVGDSIPCNAGSTPLHVAALTGSLRAIKALLQVYAMDLSAAEEEARAAGQAEPRRVTDPRLVQDRQGCLAFAIAMQRGHTRLLQALHPFTALAEIFEDDRPDERVIGVPSLVELAAMVAQKVLLADLDACEKAAADPAFRRQAHAHAHAAANAAPAAVAAAAAAPLPSAQPTTDPDAVVVSGAFAAAAAAAASALHDAAAPAAPALAAPAAAAAAPPPMLRAPSNGQGPASRTTVPLPSPFSQPTPFATDPPAAPASAAPPRSDDDEGINGAGAGAAGPETRSSAELPAPPGDAQDSALRSGVASFGRDGSSAAAPQTSLSTQASLAERRAAWRQRVPSLPRAATLPTGGAAALLLWDGAEEDDSSSDSAAGRGRGNSKSGKRRKSGKGEGRQAAGTPTGEPQQPQRRGWRGVLGRRSGRQRAPAPAASLEAPAEGDEGHGALASASAGVAAPSLLAASASERRRRSISLAEMARSSTIIPSEWHAHAAALLEGPELPSNLTPVAAVVLQLLGLSEVPADEGEAPAGRGAPQGTPEDKGKGGAPDPRVSEAGAPAPAATPVRPGGGGSLDGKPPPTPPVPAAGGDGSGGVQTPEQAKPSPPHLQHISPGGPSQSQINAAIHMVRMHRLREGMQDPVADDGLDGALAPGTPPLGALLDAAASAFHATIPEADDETDETHAAALASAAAAPLGRAPPAAAGPSASMLRARASIGHPVTGGGGMSRMGSLVRGGGGGGGAPQPVVEVHRNASGTGQHMVVMRSSLAGQPGVGTAWSLAGGARPSAQHSALHVPAGAAAALMAAAVQASARGTPTPLTPSGPSLTEGQPAGVAAAGAVGSLPGAGPSVPLPGTASVRAGGAAAGGGVQQVLTRVLTLLRTATVARPVAAAAAVAGGEEQPRDHEEEEEEDDEDECCGVCLDIGTYVDIKGCSHRLCVVCARELVRLHEHKPAPCPFCRRVIKGFSPAGARGGGPGDGAACPIIKPAV